MPNCWNEHIKFQKLSHKDTGGEHIFSNECIDFKTMQDLTIEPYLQRR